MGTPVGRSRVRRNCWLGSVLAIVACGGVERRMHDARDGYCGKRLEQHVEISKDEHYMEVGVGVREAYEKGIAECYLDRKQPDAAVSLARRWVGNRIDQLKIVARASAAAGKVDDVRVALQAIAKDREGDPEWFLETPELQPLAAQPWFREVALDAWSHWPQIPLESYAGRLVQVSGHELLPLRVAAADPDRAPGDYAVWTGVVRDARIDRVKQETVLTAEGVDVRSELQTIDRRVESVRRRSSGEVVPSYSTEKTYAERFVPNGRRFVIRYPAVSERLTRMEVVVAFGRYSGRLDPGGEPVLTAWTVADRRAREKTDLTVD